MPKWQRWSGIMKAYPFEEKRLDKWEPPYIVQPKYDGDRCRNRPCEGTSLLLSSEGNIFYSVPHIHNALLKSGLWQLPLDGELYNHKLYTEGGHNLIHSICSRTVNMHPRHEEMEFWVFDLQIDNVAQAQRIIRLKKLELPKYVKLAPFWICHSLKDIMEIYYQLIDQNYEGIIVRHFEAPYVKKRSTYVMKFKPKQSDTYKIVGVKEEVSIDGTPKGRLGALICESGDANIFSVGTGFNDEQRKSLWDIKEILSGMSAVVEYQHITPGKKVPRFPVFVKVTQ